MGDRCSSPTPRPLSKALLAPRRLVPDGPPATGSGGGRTAAPSPRAMQQFARQVHLRGDMDDERRRQLEADPRFAGFVAERGDALLRYGYVLAGNPHDAADLVQEALLKLRASWPRLRAKD